MLNFRGVRIEWSGGKLFIATHRGPLDSWVVVKGIRDLSHKMRKKNPCFWNYSKTCLDVWYLPSLNICINGRLVGKCTLPLIILMRSWGGRIRWSPMMFFVAEISSDPNNTGDEILPSYVGTIINHDRNSFETTSISWKVSEFDFVWFIWS